MKQTNQIKLIAPKMYMNMGGKNKQRNKARHTTKKYA